MKLLKRWLVVMLGLFVVAKIVPGIEVAGNGWIVYGVMAAILSLLNASLLPIFKALSCGMIVLTLGLFSLVLNGGVLLLSSWIAQNWFHVHYSIQNWWSAILASIVISIISAVFSGIDEKED